MFRDARTRLKLISGPDELTAFKTSSPKMGEAVLVRSDEMTVNIRNYVECMH
jgi:hypothetical protein